MKVLVSTSVASSTSARKALIEKKAKLEAELAEVTKQLQNMANKDANDAEANALRLVKSAGFKIRKYDSGSHEVQVGLKKSIKNAFGGIWLSVNNQGKITVTLLRSILRVHGVGSRARTSQDTVATKTMKPASTEASIKKAIESLTKQAKVLVDQAPKAAPRAISRR